MRRVTQTGYPLIEPIRPVGPEQPQTAFYLNNRYFELERRLAYPESRNHDDWKRWRRQLRRALQRTCRFRREGNE